jgi:hypothetical protein
MNLNFLLVGRPDPNAFYLVIQTVLFFGGAGRVFSLDHLLAHWQTLWQATQGKQALARLTKSKTHALHVAFQCRFRGRYGFPGQRVVLLSSQPRGIAKVREHPAAAF